MMSKFLDVFTLVFLVFIFGSVHETTSSSSSSSSKRQLQESAETFIVRVSNELKPSVFSDVKKWYTATLGSLMLTPTTTTTITTSPSLPESKTDSFIHVYRTVFHGFSARLTLKQAQELRKRPGVLSVLPDRIRHIQTTRTPQFLGLSISNNPNSLQTESDSGSNVVIGVLDTGISPERPSFHDQGLGPIPSHWKGECTEGERFSKSNCNRKIIGARYFVAGYHATVGVSSNGTADIKSARDSDGHGTHTASTAAGGAVHNASLLGFASGVAMGIAPKARLAVYKICWKRGCVDSDILAALDKAVEDGVNVISISVGGGAVTYNLDPIAIGSFAAMERGILISASAGNDGPLSSTVSNISPWITTVGASTIDRKFPGDLVLQDGRILRGSSLFSGGNSSFERTFYPLVYAGNASSPSRSPGESRNGFSFVAASCVPDSLKRELVEGKIVVCDRGLSARVAKGEVVKKAGGIGVVVANVAPLGEGVVADAHIIPGLALTESSSNAVRAYINSEKSPKARMVFKGTEIGTKPAPVVASFSARGPNPETPFVLKPDIIAPGVNIIAAWPEGKPPTELASDTRRVDFNIVSGTSMSCPHVSGIAALLKGAHPDWSPAMIRSALMTTAYTKDIDGKPLMDEKSYKESTIWSMGAGHVNPEKAQDPGLVYDLSTDDYIDFLCSTNYTDKAIREIARRSVKCSAKSKKPWDLNYPAIVVVFDKSDGTGEFDVAVTRTVTHVGDVESSYGVTVTNPRGAQVSVSPQKMEFKGSKGGGGHDREKQSYVVKIKGKKMDVSPGNPLTEWGQLIWTDGHHRVVSPVIVMWRDVY